MKDIDELATMALNVIDQAQTAKKRHEIGIFLNSLNQILNQIKERNDHKRTDSTTP